MFETHIKDFMQKKKIKAIDVYRTLNINRQNFYKALKTNNLDNPTLQKILNFLGLEILFSLSPKKWLKNSKKSIV